MNSSQPSDPNHLKSHYLVEDRSNDTDKVVTKCANSQCNLPISSVSSLSSLSSPSSFGVNTGVRKRLIRRTWSAFEFQLRTTRLLPEQVGPSPAETRGHVWSISPQNRSKGNEIEICCKRNMAENEKGKWQKLISNRKKGRSFSFLDSRWSVETAKRHTSSYCQTHTRKWTNWMMEAIDFMDNEIIKLDKKCLEMNF